MGLSTVSQNLNAIWQDYLKHLAFAMRNLNMIIDSPIIISGYLAPLPGSGRSQYAAASDQ